MGAKLVSGRKPKPFTERAKYLAEHYRLLERLAKIGGGEVKTADVADQIAASKIVLGYAYGQPTAKHEHGGENGQPMQVEYRLQVVENSGES